MGLMSVFKRVGGAVASWWGGGESIGQTPHGWLSYGSARTVAGEVVTPESANTLSVYFACVRNLSEDIAKLPLHVYERLEPRGKERVKEHPVADVLLEPNIRMSGFAFRELLNSWALGWGRGYAEIERDGAGQPVALWPIHPSRVHPKMNDDGSVRYEVHNDPRNGETGVMVIPDRNMFVLEGFNARSIAAQAAESIGLTLAAQSFGAAYYGNGMGLSMAYVHPRTLSQQAHKNMRESWEKMHQGPRQAHRMWIGEEGGKLEKISIPANEAQFLETRQFQIEEVCRWFRMPPHKVGHLERAAGWSTLEQTNTDYVNESLMPWMKRWEVEIQRKLFVGDDRENLFAEFLVLGLLRGDAASRSAYFTSMFQIGVLSQNDIRELENLNPIENGDVYYVPLNMKDSAEEEKEPPVDMQQQAMPPMDGEGEEPDPEQDDDEEDDQPDAAMGERIRLAHGKLAIAELERMVAKECKAATAHAGKHKTRRDFVTWADKFYGEHVGHVTASLAPIADSYVCITGTGNVAAAHEFAVADVERAKQELIVAYASSTVDDLCTRWTATRPATGSVEFLDMVTNDGQSDSHA